MRTRWRHVRLALGCLFGLAFSAPQRALLAEMRRFVRALPAALAGPLPAALAGLEPPLRLATLAPETVRRLADLAALLERGSPLGLCLRRSLVRYHFLRRAGLPVVAHFGAQLAGPAAERDLRGHAWITLHGQPYCEDAADWRGFTVMLSHPAEAGQ